MNDTYDPDADAIGSWYDAVTEIRDRHQQTVKNLLPALRKARLRQRLPGHVVAQQIGVAPSTLSMWECERRVPPPDLLARWCARLGL